MFIASRPTEKRLDDFLLEQNDKAFSYPELCATRATLPKNYKVDHNRIVLGQGRDIFKKAMDALYNWEMFRTSLTTLYPNIKPQEGLEVVVVAKHLGFYSLNPSRVLYVFEDELDKLKRVAFAYGTLTSHAERGEERFMITWNQDTNDVHYDLLAFSKPNKLLVKLGYPYARALQKRFAKESLQAMLKAVS